MHMSIAAFVHFLDISDKSIHFRGAGLDYWSYTGGRVPYGVTAHGCHIAHRGAPFASILLSGKPQNRTPKGAPLYNAHPVGPACFRSAAVTYRPPQQSL